MKTLPSEVTQHILAFLVADKKLRSLHDLFVHLSTFVDCHKACSICHNPVFYPYQLVDCRHVACGRCIYLRTGMHNGVAACGGTTTRRPRSCGCGQTIQYRPDRLPSWRAHHRCAQWILSYNAYQSLLQKNEAPVHNGSEATFGRDGLPNPFELFQGVGFVGDFLDLACVDIRSKESQCLCLPSRASRGTFSITHCPVRLNYSGFPTHTSFTRWQLKRSWRQLLERWVRSQRHTLCKDDVLLLEQDTGEYSEETGYEVRVVGWEHLIDKRTARSRKWFSRLNTQWNRMQNKSSEW